ncbi:MAG: bifunctional diaminohydroxyphosphoribosylaminopyrimidine deaminase/5-amino-6-(5-phosphoribosylamino)uracil reductase RibD [Candidatus Aminicenantes bacterium]|nr:MAG: bifunctional diaminohydroxyphosphoribosylaminopyrimidine deaminase/5-amino-6-(5-phosphoribosylamino)uracil reductase RibD [Candidatus Aminicenantes bacterium]
MDLNTQLRVTIDDIKFMKAALLLSKKGTGLTEPNPLVGAVVVKNNRVISSGYHARYGAPHAEQIALKNVNETGTTLYVTLEPCTHHGKTPPCTDCILKNKVKRVVMAMKDPNPLVNGKGIKLLEDQGVTVDLGLLQHVASKINRHYITYMTKKRPYVTLKAGVSIDGKLTDKYRNSQWITDETLRQYSHSFRGEFSAVMAGAQTVIDDDPQLTLREKGWKYKQLYRVILDSRNRLDTNLRIFKEQQRFPLILFSSKKTRDKAPKIEHHFFVSPDETGRGLKLAEILETLYGMGIASVLVEGGGYIFDSFLKTQRYDEIVLSTANTLIGGEASVQFFPSGASVSSPIILKKREIIPLETGYIIRGYRA